MQVKPAPSAIRVEFADPLLAPCGVLDPIAVAGIQLVLGAEPPDRVLDEAWKIQRVVRIEPPGVNQAGCLFDDLGATTVAVTGHTVLVASLQLVQYSGAVQPIMDEGVDSYHSRTGLGPIRPLGVSA